MPTDIAQLWAQLSPELTSYFKRQLPNASDAEDFVSETFLRVLRIEDHPTPQRLIYTIANALLIDEYRSVGRRRPDSADTRWPGVRDRRKALNIALSDSEDDQGDYGDALSDLTGGFIPSVEDQFFAVQHDGAIRELDGELRDAYILGELRGLPSREAGPLLGVSHATANTRRELATTTLREELSA